MRISESMKTTNILGDLNRSLNRILKEQVDLSTSKRIHRPSDDPSGTSRLMQLKDHFKSSERYEKNVEDGTQWVLATESEMGKLTDVLSEIDAILLQATNDTVGIDERKMLADKVGGLWEQAVQVGNSRFGDKYVFGGTQNNVAPYTLSNQIEEETFQASHGNAVLLENIGLSTGTVVVTNADGSVEYTEGVDYRIDYSEGRITVLASGSMVDGDDHLISYETEAPSVAVLNPQGVSGALVREIDEGTTLQINITAEDVFEGSSGVLNVLKQIKHALARNDIATARNLRGDLEVCENRSIQLQGECGNKIRRLDDQIESLQADQLNLKKVISSIEDTDVASTVLQLQKDQVAYEAALKTGASLVQVSLLNYL